MKYDGTGRAGAAKGVRVKKPVSAFNAARGEKIDLFVYGTLMEDRHVFMLIKRIPDSVPAKLNNYMKISPPWSFPLIVKHYGATTYGRILRGISTEELAIIDDFEVEGKLYKRHIVIVRTSIGRQRCQTYVGDIGALQGSFGKDVTFDDRYNTFIQKKVDRVLSELPSDRPDIAERVMHELSSSAVDEIIQSHFDGNYICNYIMIQALKEARPPKLSKLLENKDLLPYAANYMKLACKHIVLNQFVEMVRRDFPDNVRLSHQYFRHGLGILIAFSFYNSKNSDIECLIKEKKLDQIADGASYRSYAKHAIDISDAVYDPAAAKEIIRNIVENWYSTPTPLGAELEFSQLGKRAVEALPGEDRQYDSFYWFWDFDMYHRTWRLGGHVDSHMETTNPRERHRGFLEYALGRYNIVGDLSRPLFDCPWGMSALINEAVKFLDVSPHSLHVSMELPKDSGTFITDKPHREENLACLVMLGGDIRPDSDGVLRAIRIHDGELDTNRLKFLNFLDRKQHFSRHDQDESEAADVMEYKFMRLFREWTDYEGLIIALKGYQFGSKARPIKSCSEKGVSEMPEQSFLRAWGASPYPLDPASIGKFMSVVEKGILLENKMRSLDRRKKKVIENIGAALQRKNDYIREYNEKRQQTDRNI